MKLWHNPRSTSHTTLLIRDGQVYVGSTKKGIEQFKDQLASCDSPLEVLGEKAVDVSSTKIERVESQDSTITMRYVRNGQQRFTMVEMPTEEDRQTALTALADALGLSSNTSQLSPVQAATKPLLSVVGIALVTFLLSSAAAELESGETATISGRRRGLKRLLVAILDIIGPTGVYILGGLAFLAAVAWLYRRVTNPPIVTTLTPSA